MARVDDAKQLLALPYASRQLVVVGDSVEEQAVARRSDITISARIGFPFIGSVEVARAVFRLGEESVGVLTVDRQTAEALTFPVGHPRDKVLYVGHPADAGVYYPQHRFTTSPLNTNSPRPCDFLWLLGRARYGWNTSWGGLRSSRQDLACRSRPRASKLAVKSRDPRRRGIRCYSKPPSLETTRPRLPDDLIWFHHEPTWQQIAQRRLEYGMDNFQLSVIYEDDFGVNAGLKMSVAKVGLDLGGSFEDHESTVWRMNGNFGRPTEPSVPPV